MCEFEISQALIYYTHMPVFVASFLMGLFVLFADRKNQLNKNLFIFIMFFCFWVINDLLLWLILNPSINIFLSRISLLGLISMVFLLYFSYYLVGKNLSIVRKIIFALPFLPILIFMFSDYNAKLINTTRCDIEFGQLYWYVYLIMLLYLIWIPIVLLKHYRKLNDSDQLKKQIKIIIGASLFIVFWFFVFIALTDVSVKRGFGWGDNVFLFSPIGMVFFIGILAYTTTKYKFLNFKLISAQVLTAAIWILIGSQYFFVASIINILLITLTLLLAIIFGIFLIKSVKNEVKRKEELQLMSNKLSQANDQLVKLDNAKSEFISIASHQLRTPLTSIKGYASLLLEGSYGPLAPKQEDVLNKMYTSNERLVNLVEDLLNISRIESGRMEFTFDKWKMEDLCKEVVDGLMLKAKGRDLYLDFKLPETPMPIVTIDGAKVREVISNMTDNAIKYTKKGGVTVKLEFLKGPEQRVNCGEGSVRVTVADTGIGIPPEEMPYLFGKFSRGKDTSRLNTGGTGLGLYVGKRMIEANGGIIWAESEGANKGSKFIIEIPANMDEKEREERLEKLLKEI